jgi:outer membrane protein TolC
MAKGIEMSVHARHGTKAAIPLFCLFLLLGAIASAVAENQTETITLAQAIQAALQDGLDTKIAGLALEAARVQYDQAVAQSSSSLDGTASAGCSQDKLGKADSLGAGVSFSLPQTMTSADLTASYSITRNDPGVSLSVDQTIWDGYGSPFNGGKSAASLKQSALTLQVKELAARSSRQDMISKIKQAYYALLAAQHTAAASSDALDQQRAQYARTKARADSSLATSLDVRQAEINVKSAELDLTAAETALAANRRALSLAAGWPGDRLYTVAEAADPVAPAFDVPSLVATAMKNRVDVQQQDLNAQSAAITLALRKAAKSPTVSATGSVSLDTWSVGVSGKIPLLDSGLAAAQVRETELANEQARLQADQLAETVTTEVTTAVTDLKDLVSRVDLATARRDLARAQYELAQTKLGLGIGSTLDVLDALVTLTQADVSLSKAKSDVYLGILRLQDAIGTIEE